MGRPRKPTGSDCGKLLKRPSMYLLLLVAVSYLVFGVANLTVAVQRHSLEEGVADQSKTPQIPAAQDHEQPAFTPPAQEQAAPPPAQTQPKASTEARSDQQAAHGPGQAAPAPHVEPPAHAAPPAGGHGDGPAAHGEEQAGGHGEGQGHAMKLPEISPIPGVTFVDTLIALLDHELHGRTLGWRPNDILIGRFTDDINNYQLGVLEAVRFTALRLKDSLTRLGDADTYDPDLEQAVNLLMNSAYSWWFPSAEDQYNEALDHLRAFKTKLETGKRSFYYRRDNLVALLSAYKDLLGNVNRSLVMPVGWLQSDDHFYYAKGVAHVYFEMLKVVRVAFKSQLTSTMNAQDILDTVLHELSVADQVDPWIVLNSDLDGFFANHRANLNAPLSEVAHMLTVLSQL